MATPLKALCAVTALFILSVQAAVAESPLVTRSFYVNLDIVREIQTTSGQRNLEITGVNPGTPEAFARLKSLFEPAGINIPNIDLSHDTSPNQKAMFFNDRTGQLMVRTTPEEIEKIKAVLDSVTLPPEILIETVFVETAFEPPTIPFRPTLLATNQSVLTERQAEIALKIFEASTGADVLRPPQVRTVSGREVRVATEESTTREMFFQTPPQFPPDTSPAADPTPRNVQRIPIPTGLDLSFSLDKTLLIRGDRR